MFFFKIYKLTIIERVKLNDFIREYKKTKHANTKIKLTVCDVFTLKL